MKVAIMGAGLSGLACAITLEKNGVQPIVFEKRSQAGDRFINAEGLINILNKPYNNCLDYIAKTYDIFLEPLQTVKKVTFHSKNEMGSIEGNLGVTNIRGRHQNSFEHQLSRQTNASIIYNSDYTYAQLKKEFTHVVLATGDAAYATQLNNYRDHYTFTIKGATVEGTFMPNTLSAWFNQSFAPKGYAYLIPYSATEANIAFAYPDYPENISKNINDLWQQFHNQACKDLNQPLKITDQFEVTRYIVGISEVPKIDQTYFVGNCFGAISPALGFGQFVSLLTGIYAAHDICGIKPYEQSVKPLYENYNNAMLIRKKMEQLDDAHFDSIIRKLDNKLLEPLINMVWSDHSPLDVMRLLSTLLKPWNNHDKV